MKKILLFSFVVVLIVAMVVPVSAKSYDAFELPYTVFTLDGNEVSMQDYFDNGFAVYLVTLVGVRHHLYVTDTEAYVEKGTNKLIASKDGFLVKLDMTENKDAWQVVSLNEVENGAVVVNPAVTNLFKWASLPLYYDDGTPFFVEYCDGSSCPSTDVDKDNICDDCGLKFAVLRDYGPFTVKKFMNHIGQILTSAVSWVADVGSTILQQPLLLAFTALPLCGLGIAVFRRLKETV